MGRVEIRPCNTLTDNEKDALESSMSVNKEEQQIELSMCALCLVDANNEKNAIEIASYKISEALDFLDSSSSVPGLTYQKNSGIVRNLSNGLVSSCPKPFDMHFPSFLMMPFVFHPISISHWVFNLEQSDLKQALQRSLHWKRLSKKTPMLEVKFIHLWFSLEAIWKVNKDTSISPLIRWCLGFPNGSRQQDIDTELFNNIISHENYNYSRRIIIDSIEEMRELRNNISHDGFRSTDIGVQKLKRFNQILVMSSARAIQLVEIALQNNITTRKNAIEEIHNLVAKRSNWMNDLHGTVIYLIMNPNLAI